MNLRIEVIGRPGDEYHNNVRNSIRWYRHELRLEFIETQSRSNRRGEKGQGAERTAYSEVDGVMNV
jgi:hypothetical protein